MKLGDENSVLNPPVPATRQRKIGIIDTRNADVPPLPQIQMTMNMHLGYQGIQPQPHAQPPKAKIFTRRKQGQVTNGRMPGKNALVLDLQTLSRFFGVSQREACEALGIGLSTMKRVCRKLGVQAWPGPGNTNSPSCPQPYSPLLPGFAMPMVPAHPLFQSQFGAMGASSSTSMVHPHPLHPSEFDHGRIQESQNFPSGEEVQCEVSDPCFSSSFEGYVTSGWELSGGTHGEARDGTEPHDATPSTEAPFFAENMPIHFHQYTPSQHCVEYTAHTQAPCEPTDFPVRWTHDGAASQCLPVATGNDAGAASQCFPVATAAPQFHDHRSLAQSLFHASSRPAELQQPTATPSSLGAAFGSTFAEHPGTHNAPAASHPGVPEQIASSSSRRAPPLVAASGDFGSVDGRKSLGPTVEEVAPLLASSDAQGAARCEGLQVPEEFPPLTPRTNDEFARLPSNSGAPSLPVTPSNLRAGGFHLSGTPADPFLFPLPPHHLQHEDPPEEPEAQAGGHQPATDTSFFLGGFW